MDYESAVAILDVNYGNFSVNITDSLSQGACIVLAKRCQAGNDQKLNINQNTLNRLSNYDEELQASWLANPMLQFIIEKVIGEVKTGPKKVADPTGFPIKDNGKPNDNKKPVTNSAPAPAPAPKPVPKEEPEEDVGMGGLFD